MAIIVGALIVAFAGSYSNYRHGWSMAYAGWSARFADLGEFQAKTYLRAESSARTKEIIAG